MSRALSKAEFRQRLFTAVERLRTLTATMVVEPMDGEVVCWLQHFSDTTGHPPPPGRIRFLGGRILSPSQLDAVSIARAAELLWVDGAVPAWVNIGFAAVDEAGSHLQIRFTPTLLPADPQSLPRDIGAGPANSIAPFRLRGPAGANPKSKPISIRVEQYRGVWSSEATARP